MSESIGSYINELVERAREPLGLDRWQVSIEIGPQDEGNTASCDAWPEYKRAVLSFDPEKLQTGDELDEIVVHEMAHPLTWATFKLAEDYAKALAESAPKPMRKALRKLLLEQARIAGEDVNSQVGFTFIRLLRRMWAAEAEIKKLRAELRAVQRQHTSAS